MDKLLTRKQAAEYLGVTTGTLNVWACNTEKNKRRYNLPMIKIGSLCRYRISDLDKWIERRTVNNETDE